MSEQENTFAKGFLETLERGMDSLPSPQREALYRGCAEYCAKGYVLPEQQRHLDECGGDFDKMCEKYARTEFFFMDIIERGHVYEMGYPRCLCPLVECGQMSLPGHCECSRQSILFVLGSLLPDKRIAVETMHTVLGGEEECRFRVTID